MGSWEHAADVLDLLVDPSARPAGVEVRLECCPETFPECAQRVGGNMHGHVLAFGVVGVHLLFKEGQSQAVFGAAVQCDNGVGRQAEHGRGFAGVHRVDVEVPEDLLPALWERSVGPSDGRSVEIRDREVWGMGLLVIGYRYFAHAAAIHPVHPARNAREQVWAKKSDWPGAVLDGGQNGCEGLVDGVFSEMWVRCLAPGYLEGCVFVAIE